MVPRNYDQSAVRLANTAFNSVLKFNYSRQFEVPKQHPPTGLLFHYTTADGLKGIIEQNELWATNAYFLNDSTEVSYGCRILRDAIDEWKINNPNPTTPLSITLAHDLRNAFGEDLLDRHLIKPIYLACFCEVDNLLSQWRTYGQSGGYSLGFKVPTDIFTGQGFEPEPNTYTSNWVKVDYNRHEQIKKCKAILDPVLSIFDDANLAKAITEIGDHPTMGYSKIMIVIADMLLEEIVGFKNEAFEAEKEWRVVVRQRELTKQGTDDGGKTPTRVHFRSSKGMLVPYLRLIPSDTVERLPIASVRSGPTLEKTTAAMAIKLMLDNNGYSNVEVHGSDISVRFSQGGA
jgi:hypothetical protein